MNRAADWAVKEFQDMATQHPLHWGLNARHTEDFECVQKSESNPRPLALSIIIPAYNEERRLPRTLECIHAYLAARAYRAEIIVVDDGSCDRTASLVAEEGKNYPELRLISNGCNRGKGFAVRHGMLQARGEIALFTDADLSAPIEEADKLLAAICGGQYDAAIGSRAVRSLIKAHQSKLREIGGIVFNRLVRCIVGIDFADTQCGFKAFRRKSSRIIFEQQRTEGFGFDPELLFLARHHGLEVAEIPVRWAHDPATKVHFFTDSLRMFCDLAKIRWRALTGAYRRPATNHLALSRRQRRALDISGISG
jgi:glycosyltransferase involved in cell wall biosynthesis